MRRRQRAEAPKRLRPLLRAAKALSTVRSENDDERTGIDIVRRTIQSPARLIVENAGLDGSVVVGKLIEPKDYAYRFDAQRDEFGDLYKLGVSIRPRSANGSTDAASIASLLITTEALVAEKPKMEAPAPATPPGGMGY